MSGNVIPTSRGCACRERIQRAIEVGREAEKFGAPPSQAISLMERADTIEALPVCTARGSIDLTRAHTHSPIRDVTHEVQWQGSATLSCPCGICTYHPKPIPAGSVTDDEICATAGWLSSWHLNLPGNAAAKGACCHWRAVLRPLPPLAIPQHAIEVCCPQHSPPYVHRTCKHLTHSAGYMRRGDFLPCRMS